jgi:hypothetical protein
MISRSRSHVRLCLLRPVAVAFMAAYIGLSGCGPELTTPGKTDLSGTWFAGGPAAGLTSVYVTITQAPDGSISGVFTADGSPSLQFCPPTPVCTIGGTVTGSNTVLQVFLELQDAGLFTGQVITVNTMRGAMTRGSTVQPVEFTRP